MHVAGVWGWYLGDGFEDLVYLLLKVHVQQAVSLIQHQMLEQFQAEALHVTCTCHHWIGAMTAWQQAWQAILHIC